MTRIALALLVACLSCGCGPPADDLPAACAALCAAYGGSVGAARLDITEVYACGDGSVYQRPGIYWLKLRGRK